MYQCKTTVIQIKNEQDFNLYHFSLV